MAGLVCQMSSKEGELTQSMAAICQEANLTTSLARDQCDVEHINKTELVAINVCYTSDSLTVQSRL